MPGMGGYWFSPRVIASVTDRTSCGSHSKSGKPWPRFTAPCSVASADMTVKMVVPTAGNLLWMGGVRGATFIMGKAGLKLVIVVVAGHRLGDQVAVKPVAQQLGEFVHEVAQVSAALEGDSCHVLAEQVAQRAHRQVGVAAVVAHRHFGDDADAQPEADIGLDHVRIDRFQRDPRLQLALCEGVVDAGSAG